MEERKEVELHLANVISFVHAMQTVGGHTGYLLEQNATFFLMLSSNGVKVNFEVVK